MPKLRAAAILVSALGAVGGIAPATAAEGTASATRTLNPARPSWYTAELEERVLAAGRKGVEVELSRQQTIELNCLRTSRPTASVSSVSLAAVSAGGCMLGPNACTMNFIFTDGTSRYIGTAGHCVRRGKNVVMKVASRASPTGDGSVLVTLAAIGTVARSWKAGIGKDFALVRINAGWPVVSGVRRTLGPTGVFCGDPLGQPVLHDGHGYTFFVEQGHPRVGHVIPDVPLIFKPSAAGFNWVGYGLPGDSGSGVMNDGGLAVGNLTHGLAVTGIPTPSLNFGTTMQAIFNLIGTGYSLVTRDGRSVDCAGRSDRHLDD
jgi:hypothetical protein